MEISISYSITIDVPQTATVRDVKERIAEMRRIPANNQRLLFQGLHLENTRNLAFLIVQPPAQRRLRCRVDIRRPEFHVWIREEICGYVHRAWNSQFGQNVLAGVTANFVRLCMSLITEYAAKKFGGVPEEHKKAP
ncbi:hypothetical protein M3Y95_00527800 [Aphelenchoides besseyi]|nr:hypothetical protein M3Y95_00527800 [Aphelenchoides besseyi]